MMGDQSARRRARKKRRLALEVVLVVAGVAAIAFVVLRPDTDGGSNPTLARELLEMEQDDTNARQALVELGAGAVGAKLTDEQVRAIDRVEAADTRNTERLKEIIDDYGWPGRSLVGEAGASAAWLIVQHSGKDRAFQKEVIRLMKRAGPKEVDQRNLAYLIDRDLVFDEEKQTYGTQFHCVDGEHEPYAIEDPDRVDERRKHVGLNPLAEERKRELDVYGACPAT